MSVMLGTRATFDGSVRIPPAWFDSMKRTPASVRVHLHENKSLILVDCAIPEDKLFEWSFFATFLCRRKLSGKRGNQRVLSLPKAWFTTLGAAPVAVQFSIIGPGMLRLEPATSWKATY